MASTEIIYSFREGAGIGQHSNADRGAAKVNFATGDSENQCAESDFVPLHGALMLIAWMIIAPIGIYYIRYYFPQTVRRMKYQAVLLKRKGIGALCLQKGFRAKNIYTRLACKKKSKCCFLSLLYTPHVASRRLLMRLRVEITPKSQACNSKLVKTIFICTDTARARP